MHAAVRTHGIFVASTWFFSYAVPQQALARGLLKQQALQANAGFGIALTKAEGSYDKGLPLGSRNHGDLARSL